MIDREKQIDEIAKNAIYRAINGQRCLRIGHCKHCGAHKAATNPLYEKCDCYRIAEIVFEVVNGRPREGEWKIVYRGKDATVYECTACGHLTFGTSDYCICGAKMKGGESDA